MRTTNQRLLGLLCLLLIGLLASGAQAQQTPVDRALQSGVPVDSVLDNNNLIQVFTLQAAAGQTLTIAASNAIGAPLALVVTDQAGDILAQVADSDVTGDVVLEAGELPIGGLYYITVFKSAGVGSVGTLQFTLTATLSGEGVAVAAAPTESPTDAPAQVPSTPIVTAAPTLAATAAVFPAPATPTPQVPPTEIAAAGSTAQTPGQVVTIGGIQVALAWNTTDDLDLEIRDPVGGSLYWTTPNVNSGGTLGPNVNQVCEITTDTPSESASWPPGGVPTGSYEVIVYYEAACDGDNPVTFTVSPIVNGVALAPIQDTLLPGQIYVSSFVINNDGSAQTGAFGGLVDGQLLPASAAELILNAQPLTVGSEITGFLDRNQIYQSYAFDAAANDVLTVSMNAISGSLDTFLILLDSAGNIVSSNDDRQQGNTDSLLDTVLLPNAGTYTLVATRYAKGFGGTEGGYTLNIGTAATALPDQFSNLERGSLEIRLLWDTNADLQLLVRDPAGEAIFDDNRQSRSGGQLLADGNVNCRPLTAPAAFSYIAWPQNIPPRLGPYEVEVWYQNECADPNPVRFTLAIFFNGQEVFSDAPLPPLPDQRYLTSFTLEADGTARSSDAGFITGINSLDWATEREAGNFTVLVPPNQQVAGSITPDNKFDVYVFEAQAGDVLQTLAMRATSGNLDTTLYFVGPSGALLDENDDIIPGTDTNSAITSIPLLETGQYTVVATHFGALYGGTTGTYTLTFDLLAAQG
ncbi:MAG: hypothetical protein GYB67_17605 [Chloroflexi bacterium]|nr:hypothetical protein [Chloroflexota bacterium]